MTIDAILSRSDPRFLELDVAYRACPHFDTLLKGSAWESFEQGVDPSRFRGEAQYLTQLLFGATPERYQATFDYVRSIDKEGYLERLSEDGAFEAVTFKFDGITVSRDKLDSITEIYFLQETLGLGSKDYLPALDVGAGYGRFAHRLSKAMPKSLTICADAVPISTFLCEYYLKYRDRERDTTVVPLHRLREWTYWPITLATNIHSFSELKLEAINFWLDFICDLNIKYLFVVPHDDRFICVDPNGTYPDFRPAIQAHGFRLVREQPKFPAGVDGIYPTIYTLWEKR